VRRFGKEIREKAKSSMLMHWAIKYFARKREGAKRKLLEGRGGTFLRGKGNPQHISLIKGERPRNRN